jgi:hypothetical protein
MKLKRFCEYKPNNEIMMENDHQKERDTPQVYLIVYSILSMRDKLSMRIAKLEDFDLQIELIDEKLNRSNISTMIK